MYRNVLSICYSGSPTIYLGSSPISVEAALLYSVGYPKYCIAVLFVASDGNYSIYFVLKGE